MGGYSDWARGERRPSERRAAGTSSEAVHSMRTISQEWSEVLIGLPSDRAVCLEDTYHYLRGCFYYDLISIAEVDKLLIQENRWDLAASGQHIYPESLAISS